MRSHSRDLSRHLLPALLTLAVAALPLLGVFGGQVEREFLLAAIYSLLVVGFNLTFGYGGQLALGQVAVFAGGAYTTAILFDHGIHELAIAVLASIAVAAVLGVLTGLPGLRLTNWVLALVSFFLVILITPITNVFSAQTGGTLGIPGVVEPQLFGMSLSTQGFYIVVVGSGIVCLGLYRNLVFSRYGRALQVVRHGRVLVGATGLSSLRLRISAYVLGGLPAGVAGAFYAYYASYVQASLFDFSLVTLILAISVIAGIRSIWSIPVAAAILVIGPELISSFGRYSVLIYGCFLMAAGLGLSSGIGGLARAVERRFGKSDGGAEVSGRTVADAVATAPAIAGETLAVAGVTKRFGGVEALRKVDFVAGPGQVTAIIGANGAGKTTLLNVISGHISADEGTVKLGDRKLTGLSAAAVAKAGVARTFQTPQIPDSLTTMEIATSGRLAKRRVWAPSVMLRLPRFLRAERDDVEHGREALRFVGLHERQGEVAETLPLGSRRILEVARCITSEPGVVLLDEPAAGLDPGALAQLGEIVRTMREAGATVVLIEHNVGFVMDIADSVMVLELGAVIAHAEPESVRRDERVMASYLGHRDEARSEPVAEARDAG